MEPYVLKQPRSPGMVVGGILLSSFSLVAFVAGAAMLSADSGESDSQCIPDVPCNPAPEDHTLRTAGVVTLITGGVLLGVGIPLLLYGSKKVPVKTAPPAARFMPEVRVGPLGGALRWKL
jgi:hypothetical protein